MSLFATSFIGFATTVPYLELTTLENEVEQDSFTAVVEEELKKEITVNVIYLDNDDFGFKCFYSIVATVFGPDGRSYSNNEYFSAYALSEGHYSRMAGNKALSLQDNVSRRVGSLHYSIF